MESAYTLDYFGKINSLLEITGVTARRMYIKIY